MAPVNSGAPVQSAPSSTCTQRFTDDFDRSNRDIDGDNGWTTLAGSAAISSNALVAGASGTYVGSGTDFTAATQYWKVEMTTFVSTNVMGALFRSDVDGAPAYSVYANTTDTTWDDGATVQSASIGLSNGNTVGRMVTGTGNDTVIGLWVNPTNDKPFSGGPACTVTSTPCWDDADDAPDTTFTNNPATAADAYTSFALFLDASGMTMDNLFYGDCSD
jgi:hypothetical protein